MLTMQVGDIWKYDLRDLYPPSIHYYKFGHWLVLDVLRGDEYAKILGYVSSYYRKEDVIIHYLCMETGQQAYKVFPHREWGELDLQGNPYYKKVA
jgi:hypothetical protein